MASRSPLLTLFNLVSRLPRRGRISKPRPNALSCAARRGEDVPTSAPTGNSPSTSPSRATRASRGSLRSGIAAIVNLGSSAVGRSLCECTAASARPSSIASRSALVKTPTPRDSMGAEDSSPTVLMITSSAGWPLAMRASRMPAAWVVANRLPRVPIRITCANRLLGGLDWAITRTIARATVGVRVESAW